MMLSNPSSENGEGLAKDVVVLIVPPSANTPQLFRFIFQLDKILCDNHGSISNMVPCWDWGTLITTRLDHNKVSDLLGKLNNMPEVEKVEEEPLARDSFPSLSKRFGILSKSSVSPGKRVRVILVNQELAPVLNQHEGHFMATIHSG